MYDIKLVNENEPILHRRLGLTDERAFELEEEFTPYYLDQQGAKGGGTSYLIAAAAKVAKTDTEFALLCLSIGMKIKYGDMIERKTLEQFTKRHNEVRDELKKL